MLSASGPESIPGKSVRTSISRGGVRPAASVRSAPPGRLASASSLMALGPSPPGPSARLLAAQPERLAVHDDLAAPGSKTRTTVRTSGTSSSPAGPATSSDLGATGAVDVHHLAQRGAVHVRTRPRRRPGASRTRPRAAPRPGPRRPRDRRRAATRPPSGPAPRRSARASRRVSARPRRSSAASRPPRDRGRRPTAKRSSARSVSDSTRTVPRSPWKPRTWPTTSRSPAGHGADAQPISRETLSPSRADMTLSSVRSALATLPLRPITLPMSSSATWSSMTVPSGPGVDLDHDRVGVVDEVPGDVLDQILGCHWPPLDVSRCVPDVACEAPATWRLGRPCAQPWA